METNAELIRACCEEREIAVLCHFTWRTNLPSIFRNGLVPRASLGALIERGESCTHLDGVRLDGHTDGTCLSITHPNYKMLWSYRQQIDRPTHWCVLLLDPAVLWEKRCAFYFRNAAHHNERCRNINNQGSVDRFEAMFYEHLVRVKTGEKIDGTDRNSTLKPNEPTNPQAEVLVLEDIEPRYLLRVAFLSRDGANGAIAEVQVIKSKVPIVVESRWFDARRDYADWKKEEHF